MATSVGNLASSKQIALSRQLNPTQQMGNYQMPQIQSLQGTNPTMLPMNMAGLIKPPTIGSLGSTPVVKHIIAPDGTQTVTHAQPKEGAKNQPPKQQNQSQQIQQSQQATMPEIRMKEGKHHVPFMVGGHTIYMDSDGNMSQ